MKALAVALFIASLLASPAPVGACCPLASRLEGSSARLIGPWAAAPSRNLALDPIAARAALDEVLADPVFRGSDWLSILPLWVVPVALVLKVAVEFLWNVMRWPIDRLLDLVVRIVGEVLNGPVVVALGLLVAGGLVLLYQRGLRSAIVRQAEIPRNDEPLPPTASEALTLAARQAAASRYREACHFVLLSTLLAVQERGHARFDPSATNREHLARLAGWPPLARALERVVGRFDRIWYGQDAVSESDYHELLSLADRVAEAAA